MSWIAKWMDIRNTRELKRKIAKMKIKFEEIQTDLGMPALETISGRILKERILLLEKAVETKESRYRNVSE